MVRIPTLAPPAASSRRCMIAKAAMDADSSTMAARIQSQRTWPSRANDAATTDRSATPAGCPGAGPATRRDGWARLRRSLWQPPRPHGEQPHERVVGPLELFYDLAVVVLVAEAARHLAGHLTWRGLGEFAVVFTLVWIAWANGSLHHELRRAAERLRQ